MSSQPVDRLVAVAEQVLDLQPHRRKPGSLRMEPSPRASRIT